MKGWLFLVIAIVGEVIATSALKSSEGFTKLAPSAVVIIGYGIAFYFLSLVLKSIPVGVAYAVWSGLGVVIITAIAWLLHGQKLDAWGFVGMGLIIAAGTVAKLAMRQPFVLFKGLTFQKLCLPGAFRPGDHHNKMLRPGLCVVHASPQYL